MQNDMVKAGIHVFFALDVFFIHQKGNGNIWTFHDNRVLYQQSDADGFICFGEARGSIAFWLKPFLLKPCGIGDRKFNSWGRHSLCECFVVSCYFCDPI